MTPILAGSFAPRDGESQRPPAHTGTYLVVLSVAAVDLAKHRYAATLDYNGSVSVQSRVRRHGIGGIRGDVGNVESATCRLH
jgi:hypothetical protein